MDGAAVAHNLCAITLFIHGNGRDKCALRTRVTHVAERSGNRLLQQGDFVRHGEILKQTAASAHRLFWTENKGMIHTLVQHAHCTLQIPSRIASDKRANCSNYIGRDTRRDGYLRILSILGEGAA